VLPLLLKKVRNCAAAAMGASQQVSEKQKIKAFLPQRRKGRRGKAGIYDF
jgi:hypothetical protein